MTGTCKELTERNVEAYMKSLSHRHILVMLRSKMRKKFLEVADKHGYGLRMIKE